MQDLEPLLVFTDPLESLGLDYFVTGSIASIIYGEPRLTHDIDLVLSLQAHDANRLVQAYAEDTFYCPPAESLRLESQREDRGHFNIIHHATGFKADIYLKGSHPLHAWAFEHRRRIPLPNGSHLQVAPPEYVILRKLEFFNEGGSDKHLHDIRGILEVTGTNLDCQAIEQWVDRLGLRDTWNRARA